MRVGVALLCAMSRGDAGRSMRRRASPPKKTPPHAKKAPEPPPQTIQAEWQCASELGIGVTTGRRFCDVLTGNDPKEGVLITIPPHRGPVTMSFELHNRHTYSAELVKLEAGLSQIHRDDRRAVDGQHAGRSRGGAERVPDREGFVRSHRRRRGSGRRQGGGAVWRRVHHHRVAGGRRRAGVGARREAVGDASRRRRQLHRARGGRSPPSAT